MARIPQETIDAMKQQVDLLALVRAKGVGLKRHGRNWKGCCPFHDDHDPSLIVTPHKRLWNCLGCNAGGDAYQWVMKSENVSFRRAHEILSERWSVGGAAANSKPRKATRLAMPVDLNAEGQPLLKQVIEGIYSGRIKTDEFPDNFPSDVPLFKMPVRV